MSIIGVQYVILIILLYSRESLSKSLDFDSTNQLEGSGDIEITSSTASEISDSTTEKLGFIDKPVLNDKPLSNISSIIESDDSSCSRFKPEQLREKAQYIIEKYIPALLKLKRFSRGLITSVTLENGNLIVKSVKLLGQPLCSQSDDGDRVYDFMVAFEDLTGFYDWKITNFFRYNYAESAMITIKKLVTQLVFKENNNALDLTDVKIGAIDGLDVKVNIPEDILSNRNVIKNFMEYVVSRITSMIANRSKDMIIRHMESILSNDIKVKLNEKNNNNNINKT